MTSLPLNAKIPNMTAMQVIDEIKALDPKERAKVLDVLRELDAPGKLTDVDDQAFSVVADRVLTRHAELLQKLAR